MSILTKPQVRPDALFSLLHFIDIHGSEPNDTEIITWMVPGSDLGISPEKREQLGDNLKALRDVASNLGFIEKNRWRTVSEPPKTRQEFSDRLHTSFIEQSEQVEIIDVYASAVVEIETKGMAWLSGSVKEISDVLRDRIARPDQQGATGIFNDTRWAAWTAWLTEIGLGFPGPKGITPFFFHPTKRLDRVLRMNPNIKKGKELPAQDLLDIIAQEMPYLDGGERLSAAWHRINDQPSRNVSRTLSNALRDFNTQGILKLLFTGGDHAGSRQLSDDGSEPEAFATVSLG
jgi:hypothetical protein